MGFMRDSIRRFNETMKQIKRGKIVCPVRTFNVKRVGHNIPVPDLEKMEVRPMSMRQIKKRVMALDGEHVLAVDSREYYKEQDGKPKTYSWKAYGKNTPPERVSRIIVG